MQKTEISNNELKKYKEKNIFLYELSFIVEFILYDDSNMILANSIVEAKRSTTSGKYISIQQSSLIIDDLIHDCILDFANKSKELIKLHLNNFVI